MKKTYLFNVTLLLVNVLFLPDSLAQDYTRWNLPEGVLARLGKGNIALRDRAVAYSPDGTRLAVASSIGVWLYDVHTGAEVALFIERTSFVYSVAFSPDGKTLASGNWDGTVQLWEVSTGQVKATLEGDMNFVLSVAFSPDGKTLASGGGSESDSTVQLWDVSSGQLKATLKGDMNAVESVAFSSDSATLASASMDGTVRLWEVSTGQVKAILKGHMNYFVYSVAFSPDGKTLASGSDSTVQLWDVSSGQLKATLEGYTSIVISVAFSPDGKTLASGGWGDGTVRLWEVSTSQVKATFEGHTHVVTSVAFSPDGKTLASASPDGTVRLWDVSSGQVKATLEGHTDAVESVAFSPDGTFLASGNWDGTVRLWEVSSGQLQATLEGHTHVVISVAFSPDGKTLASGGGGEQPLVRLWEVSSGQLQATLEGHTDAVTSVAFSPDGTFLASGNWDGTVRLWEVSSGQVKATLEGHTNAVESVAFSPDGKTLASASRDGTIRLWEVSSDQLQATLEGHTSIVTSVAFSPDGTSLASASWDSAVRLWDPDSGQHKTTLEGHTDWIWSVAFSPDGTSLASASRDGTVRLWDPDIGQLQATLEGHTSIVTSVAFSPDGTSLASASRDGTIRLWDMLNIPSPPVDISVPLGFAVEKWSSLEPVTMDLIANPEYGMGIMGATIRNAASDNGEVLLWRFSSGSEELVARIPAELVNAVPTVRFDQTGLFDNKLFVTINAGPAGRRKTRVVIVEPNGEFRDAINIYDENSTQASIEFINQPSYPAGAYIYDADIGQGQSFYRLDDSFNLHLITSHTLPADRSDIDPMDLKADPTGKYGGLLTLSDTDLNHEELSGLYQLQADGEWRTLVSPAPVSERQFQGIAFSNAGPLGSALYVADAVTDNIWIVSPKGHIEAFAVGFTNPQRVAIGPEGTDMWVADQTGLYRIFSTDSSDQVASKATLPVASGLEPNYPNPFNSFTQIPYRVSALSPVRLVIYNTLGQPVRTLVDAIQAAGAYQVSWDGRDHRGAHVANGIYLYRLQAGGVSRVRKMLVLE